MMQDVHNISSDEFHTFRNYVVVHNQQQYLKYLPVHASTDVELASLQCAQTKRDQFLALIKSLLFEN